jgi:hypothetical protein
MREPKGDGPVITLNQGVSPDTVQKYHLSPRSTVIDSVNRKGKRLLVGCTAKPCRYRYVT